MQLQSFTLLAAALGTLCAAHYHDDDFFDLQAREEQALWERDFLYDLYARDGFGEADLDLERRGGDVFDEDLFSGPSLQRRG